MRTDLPGPASRAILERQAPLLYPGLAHGLGPFVIARKEGFTVEDVDGNVFWDFISAMASVPLGSARADITDAAVEAMRRYGMEDTHFYTHEFVLPLAEKLLAAAPAGLTRVDIALNGTEAVETAVRFMRRATGRPIVIGFMGGYHGEAGTAGAVGAETGDLSYGYRALMPGFVHVPYPNPYRTPVRAAPGRHGRRHGRLPARPPAVPRDRPARGRRVPDRAGDGLGRVRRAARRVLDGARPSSAASSTCCSASTR